MNDSRRNAVTDALPDSLNGSLPDSLPSRAPADQGSGSRDQGIREVAGNSIHPTSRNVERDPATMAMDGPRCDNPDTCPSWADCGGPCRPIEPSGLQSPVGRWVAPRGGYVEDRDDAESDAAFRDGLAAIRERGARTAALPRPVAAVVACPEVLVVACARAQWDAHRVEALKRFPSSRIPEWDDDLGWSMGREWVHGRECDAMRERLEVLWPVIVEHLGWA